MKPPRMSTDNPTLTNDTPKGKDQQDQEVRSRSASVTVDMMAMQNQYPTVIDFFQQFTAYHIMPTSARILTIDADTSIYRAYRIMADNAVSSAFVWDRQTQLYTSVVTSTDVMRASLIMYDQFLGQNAKFDPILFCQKNSITFEGAKPGIHDLLQRLSIRTVKAKSALIHTNTNTSLYEAIGKMLAENVHRLPVIDQDGSIVLQLTYRQICRFLVSKFKFQTSVLEKCVTSPELDVAKREFATIRTTDTVYTAIQALVKGNLSSIPIIDENDKLYNVFSKYDFQVIGNNGIIDLDAKIKAVVDQRPTYMEGCVTMSEKCTLAELLRLIADKNLHRMMLVDENDNKKLVAVVSLRMVLKYLTQAGIYEATPMQAGSQHQSLKTVDYSHKDSFAEDDTIDENYNLNKLQFRNDTDILDEW